MTDEQKMKLGLLTEEYKEAYIKAGLAIEKRDEIKNKIKELAGEEDFENDNVSFKHFEKETIQYKQMIVDANITVPDKYKTKRTETRLSIKKPKVTDESN